MPMYNFIKLSVTGDLKWLIKTGNPNNLDLYLEKIQSEYNELSGSNGTSEILKSQIQYRYFINKLDIFNSIVSQLQLSRNDELIQILIEMGFNYSFNDLKADLNKAITQSKQWVIKINHASSIIKSLTAKSENSPPSEKSWYDSLSAIAKYRTIPNINPRNITVIEYISMEKDFTEYINFMKSQQNGR